MWNVISALLVILLGLLGFATILALLMPSVRVWFISHRRGIVTAVTVVAVGSLAVWWMWPSSTPPVPSAPSAPGTGWSSLLQPTPEGVWKFFRDYWLWMILALAILFFASNALPDSWAKAAKGLVVVIVVTLVGAMAVHGIWGDKPLVPSASSRTEVPLASSPQSEWSKLVIPAGRKSQFVPRPSGMKIRMAGQNFEGFNVFEGSECSFLKTCPEGSLGAYARNLSEEENIISYAYVPD